MSSRRGAAYGIAGLVKGSGIKSLSSYDIIRNLTDAAEEKDAIKRESVSVAFETLSEVWVNTLSRTSWKYCPLFLNRLVIQYQK